MILSEAIRIAKLAGTKIKELRESKQYTESVKAGYELVTTADLISNDIIKAEINKIFGNHEILSEVDNYTALECINGNNIIISSPKVFDELKHILA